MSPLILEDEPVATDNSNEILTVRQPFQRGKWKRSTKGTPANRIRHHVVTELGDMALTACRLSVCPRHRERPAPRLRFRVLTSARRRAPAP